MARLINQESGGAVIAPWEIGQLDEEWIDVFHGLRDVQKMRDGHEKFERRLAEIRGGHPTYRKYH